MARERNLISRWLRRCADLQITRDINGVTLLVQTRANPAKSFWDLGVAKHVSNSMTCMETKELGIFGRLVMANVLSIVVVKGLYFCRRSSSDSSRTRP